MKHLKKAAVVLLSVLMLLNSTTAVFAEDEEATAEPASSYSLHYEFVLKDSDEKLPEEVMVLLPEDRNDLHDGDEIHLLSLENVETEDALYSFLGWSPESFTVNGEDVEVIGTWGKVLKEIELLNEELTEKEDPSQETEEPAVKEEEVSRPTYKVEFRFLKWNSLSDGDLPETVMNLLPETKNVPVGEDPKLPEYEIIEGYQFKGWEKAQYTNDEGQLHTVFFGLWDRLKFRVIPVSGNPGYEGAVHVVTGGELGVSGSRVPKFSINGNDAYCVTPWIKGYAVTGTSYYSSTYGYGDAGSLPEEVANIIITGKARGASDAIIQAAIWDFYGENHGVNWRDYYNPGIEAWGEIYETYMDPNDGSAMQDLGIALGYREKGGYVRVYKKASETTFNYVRNCPNNYSLAGAEYGVYTDVNCTHRVAKLTTGGDGGTGKSDLLEVGTYYIKEISPSPGFYLDTRVYPISVTAGNTASITSTEEPMYDPLTVNLYKFDRRESIYVKHLNEAQFTLKYYDAQTNDVRSLTPKFTWVFSTFYNDSGKAVCSFNPQYLVEGPDPAELGLIDSNGEFFLPLGTFSIEETTAPQLFARDENIYIGHIANAGGSPTESVDHYIDPDGTVHELSNGNKSWIDVDNLDLSQEEELQTIQITIQKVNEETGKAELPEDHITSTATLEGGVFHIWRIGRYDDSDEPKMIDIAPIDYGTLITDAEGKCSLEYEPGTTDGLLPGKFRIIEEKAPNGFAINEKEFILEAPVKERNTAAFQYSLQIGDKLTRIQIEKLDDKGDLVPKEATATIQLIETDTGRVVYEFVADGSSHVIYGLTTLMNYHLHELYVAPNFRLAIDKDVVPIEANDSEMHYYHMVDHGIEIHTTASFSDEGKKEWDNPSGKHYVADGVAHIFDEVSYKNIYEGETYILEGELFDRTENKSLDNVVRKEFVPKYDVGIETLEFEQQLDDLDNHDLVVFETLYHVKDGEEVKVAEHKDPEDEDQTIYVDELYRADFEILKVNADDTEEPLSGVTFHITSHRVKRDGVVEDYDLGEFTTDENGRIFIEKLKEDTVLTITETKEKDPTWYRWEEPFTFDIGHDSSITLHSDPIENHQIRIGTSALFEESGNKNYVADGVAHIIDTVNYEWLYQGDQYKLVATLIDKGTAEEPLEEEVTTVEHEFTASGLHGSEDVIIEFSLDGYDNHDFVVFEELYRIIEKEDGSKEEIKVAEHKDIDDEDQTVHVDELYRAAMVLYKIGNGNKDIKLNGAYFNVTTKRTKRDGTLVEKDLGTYVTGGILVERDAAFKATVYCDEALTTSIRSVESSYDSNLKKQAVTLLSLPEGEYWVKVEGEEDAKKYEVSKGTIVLFDQPEDTEVTFTELVAPAGYYIDRKPFIVNVGHDYELERVENYRSNSLIIITNRIPDTGYDG